MANSDITNLHENTVYSFNIQSLQTNMNNAIHEWMTQIRSIMPVGSNAFITGQIVNVMTYGGFVWKVTAQVLFGIVFTPNSPIGYYFRDSSSDATASSTTFDLST